MSDDMTLSCGNGFVNIRVGAIILKDGKFLMVSDKHFDYCYSVADGLNSVKRLSRQ